MATADDVIAQGDLTAELAIAEHAVVASDMTIRTVVLRQVTSTGESCRVLRAVAVHNSPLVAGALSCVGEDLVACWASVVLAGLVTSKISDCGRVGIAKTALGCFESVDLLWDGKSLHVDIACGVDDGVAVVLQGVIVLEKRSARALEVVSVGDRVSAEVLGVDKDSTAEAACSHGGR